MDSLLSDILVSLESLLVPSSISSICDHLKGTRCVRNMIKEIVNRIQQLQWIKLRLD